MKPIPIRAAQTEPTFSKPVAGTFNATGASLPFRPELGRKIWVVLKGTFNGSVELLRSIDGGVTKQRVARDAQGNPVTAISANGAVQVAMPTVDETSDRARYYLSAELVSGSVDYEIHQ